MTDTATDIPLDAAADIALDDAGGVAYPIFDSSPRWRLVRFTGADGFHTFTGRCTLRTGGRVHGEATTGGPGSLVVHNFYGRLEDIVAVSAIDPADQKWARLPWPAATFTWSDVRGLDL